MTFDYQKLIDDTERDFESRLSSVSCDALRKNCRIVLVTGGSCAGKTTCTAKLDYYFTAAGKNAHCISLDDFYRFGNEKVYLPDGKADIESPASLRLDLINEAVTSLLALKPTKLPRFDFVEEKRYDAAWEIIPNENDIFIIEGLHAHNPLCFPQNAQGIYKLFLYAEPEENKGYARFIRRLVRDSIYRGASAERTFRQWQMVKDEEERSITPYFSSADGSLNTYFAYEKHVLGKYAKAQLETLPENSVYRAYAASLHCYLADCGYIPAEAVPEHSLLKEFI